MPAFAGKACSRLARALIFAGGLSILMAPVGVALAEVHLPPETIEADISTHEVAVETDFAGVHVIIFGAVANSRQRVAEDGLYDVVLVLQGPGERSTMRKKTHVAGIWINTDSETFEAIPSYYAIVSTRPLDEIADASELDKLGIGFRHLNFRPVRTLSPERAKEYETSIVRIKRSQNLYRIANVGVAFIASSLFRASVDLPANVSVGEFTVKAHLFREGRHLSSYSTTLDLSREGVERVIHSFAFDYPFLYGVLAVIVAVLAGLASTAIFKRR